MALVFTNPAMGTVRQPSRAVVRSSRACSLVPKAAFQLMDLPYEMTAFGDDMSKSTFEFHWGKHHRAYVDNLNKQLESNTSLQGKTLEEVIIAAWNNGSPTPEFNNAAQIWNHDFFWEGIAPNAGGKPTGTLAEAIDKSFGSYEEFAKQFKAAGATQFGSGWAWLVVESDGSLAVTKTPNAVNPLCEGKTAILTMDVWEHAYYLDVQNRRPAYIDTYVEKLINWGKVQERFDAATA